MKKSKSSDKLIAFGKQLSSVDTYYVGKDTFIGELPALRLLTREYADKKDADAALGALRDQFPNARICDWQDLFDIDNPKEVIDDAQRIASEQKAKRHAEAKKAVVETLSCTLDGKEIPLVLTTFIVKCWAPYLAHVHLEQGANSASWSDALHTLRELVTAAQPEHTWLELETIFGEVDLYFDALKQRLSDSPTFKSPQDEEFARLWDWYRELAVQISSERDRDESSQSARTASSQTPASDPSGESTEGSPTLEDEVATTETKPSEVRVPPEVVVGNWFELYIGHGKPKRYLKLTRIVHETASVLFSDAKGRGALEIDLHKFLDDFSGGKTVVIREGNQFDQALSRVIGSIRNQNAKRKSA